MSVSGAAPAAAGRAGTTRSADTTARVADAGTAALSDTGASANTGATGESAHRTADIGRADAGEYEKGWAEGELVAGMTGPRERGGAAPGPEGREEPERRT